MVTQSYNVVTENKYAFEWVNVDLQSSVLGVQANLKKGYQVRYKLGLKRRCILLLIP